MTAEVTCVDPPRAAGRATALRLGLSVPAGALTALAGAPWELRWALPVGVCAAVVLLRGARVRVAALTGLGYGLGYVLLLTGWLRAVGVDAWLLVGGATALFYAVLGAGIALVVRLRAWPLWVACWWVGVETAVATWPFGGFPWTRLAWSTLDTPFAAWFPWVGAAGVSLLVVLLGAGLAWSLAGGEPAGPGGPGGSGRWRRLGLVGAGAAVVVLLPAVAPAPSLGAAWGAGAPTLDVAAVQGDVPGAGNDLVAVHREVTANHVAATVDLAARVRRGEVPAPDLVLWPENSTAVDPVRDTATRAGIEQAVAAVGVPVLVGAIVDGPEPGQVRNQGIVWTPQGDVGERYTKRHPVPFGEYVPFRSALSWLPVGRLAMIPRDMQPGTRERPLDVAGARVADVICFDVAFDDALSAQVARGAQIVTVQTSNATFTGTAQLDQQFGISRLRAMEVGRSVVVASTNGISGVIGPDGRVRDRLDVRTTGVLSARVPLVERQTLATRYGAPLRRGLAALGVGAVLVGAVVRRRASRGPEAVR